eukprot:6039277-Pleurochrysis_carterae.AAC.1
MIALHAKGRLRGEEGGVNVVLLQVRAEAGQLAVDQIGQLLRVERDVGRGWRLWQSPHVLASQLSHFL